jgi:enoyl-CoA hydratase
VIAAVNGAAAGIGFAFVLAADLSAAQSAKFVNSIHNAGTGHELA